MCLPVWEEGENVLNKREEKERETTIAHSQTLLAYSAPSTALRPFHGMLTFAFGCARAHIKTLLTFFYAHCLGGGVREGETSKTY